VSSAVALASLLLAATPSGEAGAAYARADADAVFAKVDPSYPPLSYARAEAIAERDPAEARRLLTRYLAMPRTPDFPTRREAEKLLAKLR
jgi:hypothetical protein